MADVAVSTQLQQWSFDKPRTAEHQDPDSSASSPRLSHPDNETLRVDTAAVAVDKEDEVSLQERYLSSEEDLSPMEEFEDDSDNDDDDVISIHNEDEKECFQARKMSVSRFEMGKSCDMAVMVSMVSARPKVIDLAANANPPVREHAQRSASLAQLPMAAIQKLKNFDQGSRLSLQSASTSRSLSPATNSVESRRPSTGHIFSSNKTTSFRSSDSSSFTDGSSRSSSPAISERSTMRPKSMAAHRPGLQPRSSLYISSTSSQPRPFAPLTPLSPETPSFLDSDPYETSMTSSASPIIKSSGHRRLRSISMKLSLAKIAITPSTKRWDSRINGKSHHGNMPPTPGTPYTPLLTPQTAPPSSLSNPLSFSPKKGLKRHSKISRPTSSNRGPSPDMSMPPPVPAMNSSRLVPRGANEREPTLQLPDFPEEEDPVKEIVRERKIRKRKSLMDLLLESTS